MATWFSKNGAGLLLAFALAIPAWFFGKAVPVVGAPVTALLLGMVICTVTMKTGHSDGYFMKKSAAGLKFTSKKILQYAVILLGFGLDLKEILKVGSTSLWIILGTISISLIVSWLFYRATRCDKKIATLIGVGSSICGGSAIAAAAPVIEAHEDEIAQAMSVIFLFNVLAALIFPSLGAALGMSNEGFGVFAGTAVNDTSSVTAAASVWDSLHGSDSLRIATIVKLTRTLAIIPICIVLAVMTQREKGGEGKGVSIHHIFPYFILYFVLASVITTVFSLPPEFTKATKLLSKFFIVMAMGSIGLKTDLIGLIKGGGKSIAQGALCWVSISCVSLLLQSLQGMW